MSELMQAALEYAKMGFFVHPLKPGEKSPDSQHGFYDATTDLNRIEKWWEENPDRNIGVAMGHGISCFDFDEDEMSDKHGLEIKRDWELEHGKEFPETWICCSPRGGSHWIYRDPVNRKVHLDLYHGIDFMGSGSYVIFPPSRRSDGKEYFWEYFKEDLPIGVVDGTVEEFLIENSGEQKTKEEKKRKVQNYADPITVADPRKKVQKGSRTKTMMRLIGRMVWNGICDESVQAVVQIENACRFEPPFTNSELETTILTALDRGWVSSSPYWIDQKSNERGEKSWKKKNETNTLKTLTRDELRELYQRSYQLGIVKSPEQFVAMMRRLR